jgi:hypothetical protein
LLEELEDPQAVRPSAVASRQKIIEMVDLVITTFCIEDMIRQGN